MAAAGTVGILILFVPIPELISKGDISSVTDLKLFFQFYLFFNYILDAHPITSTLNEQKKDFSKFSNFLLRMNALLSNHRSVVLDHISYRQRESECEKRKISKYRIIYN